MGPDKTCSRILHGRVMLQRSAQFDSAAPAGHKVRKAESVVLERKGRGCQLLALKAACFFISAEYIQIQDTFNMKLRTIQLVSVV